MKTQNVEKGDEIQIETIERKGKPAAFFSLAEVVAVSRDGITIEYCSVVSWERGQVIPKWKRESVRWMDVKRFRKFAA